MTNSQISKELDRFIVKVDKLSYEELTKEYEYIKCKLFALCKNSKVLTNEDYHVLTSFIEYKLKLNWGII